jgi:hypothetical protein
MLSSGGRSLLSFLGSNTVTKLSTRNTVIVSRVYKPPLVGVNGKREELTGRVPQKLIDKSVIHTDDDKYMIYQIESTKTHDQPVKVILLKTIEDYGVKGQIISPPSTRANRDLLLTKLAVYHNQENLEKYADIVIPEDTKMFSSQTALLMTRKWAKKTVSVDMSLDNEWRLEKWHLVAMFRKYRLWLTEDQIHIPSEESQGKISGPDINLENKEFIVQITINNFDKVKVRCRIHQVSRKNPEKESNHKFWYSIPSEPVWETERQELEDMPRRKLPWRMRQEKQYQHIVQFYDDLQAKRLAKLVGS